MATLTVQNSTLSANSASVWGGGIYNGGTLTVTNSTLSANSTSNHGGGIFNYGTLTVTNSTLSANSTPAYGGGIYNHGTLTVQNSTLSANSASSEGGGLYNEDWLNLSNNTHRPQSLGRRLPGRRRDQRPQPDSGRQLQPGHQRRPAPWPPGRQRRRDPHPRLLPGSPAIDAGNDGTCLATDQRGIPRPHGAACDIGAFESQGFIFLPVIHRLAH
jgi:hypothetical protein